jgi:hypothetical protein
VRSTVGEHDRICEYMDRADVRESPTASGREAAEHHQVACPVVKTLTKKQHIADGRGLVAVAACSHGILRRTTAASRAPHSSRPG